MKTNRKRKGSLLKQGFITVEGGHRVGVAGKVIIENEKVKNIQYISSLNVRISHEVLGCADALIPYITENKQICHTLIISPPCCGKTTLIRDLIRQISDGNEYIKGCSVGVVDERSEIAGCFLGEPQNDVGMRTDVLDNCPKDAGMEMLLRSMAPQILAVDEIATERDVQTLQKAMHCGTKVLATVHGTSFSELEKKPFFLYTMRKENSFYEMDRIFSCADRERRYWIFTCSGIYRQTAGTDNGQTDDPLYCRCDFI